MRRKIVAIIGAADNHLQLFLAVIGLNIHPQYRAAAPDISKLCQFQARFARLVHKVIIKNIHIVIRLNIYRLQRFYHWRRRSHAAN